MDRQIQEDSYYSTVHAITRNHARIHKVVGFRTSPVKSSHHREPSSAHQPNAIIEIMVRWRDRVGPHLILVQCPLSLPYNMKTIYQKKIGPHPPQKKPFWIRPWKLQ